MIAYAIYIIFALNVITFAIYGIDKYRARKKQWRIPEATLILLALSGGSVGALIAMQTFHHKTQKRKFSIGVPLILIIQATATCYAIYHWVLNI